MFRFYFAKLFKTILKVLTVPSPLPIFQKELVTLNQLYVTAMKSITTPKNSEIRVLWEKN